MAAADAAAFYRHLFPNENRENSSVDLRAAWVFCAADILFDGQALSFGGGGCGMDGIAVAAVSWGGGT
jgi:hypothetical protein